MKKVNILGCELEAVTGGELSDLLDFKKKLKIAKINTEFLNRAENNNEFKDTLNSFDLRFADGIGVLWAAKYLSLSIAKYRWLKPLQAIWQAKYTLFSIVFAPKYLQKPLPEAIPGVEALKIMLGAAQKSNASVFLFGATQKDLEGSIVSIKKDFPKLKIAGSLNGYDWQNDDSIKPIEIINETDAKLLIVALGSPLQEYWIRDNFDELKNIMVAVGEGGSLAFLAGTIKRPPQFIHNIGLEWLWRLFFNRSLTHQTGSRVKRVWNAVPVFIWETIKWKIKNA